ncbi:RNB domain-containing ribonuclease [Streptomyces purpureus]|uniref:Ribonuclease R n=1 Tax=Streptomyces purpureus TaxID=1951 RepID=A0A918H0I3_9ACTN|nr:RNB domain-containing ribonuclease [Streptomyces purpureus]GGT26643.1 ribonuclease R [Streptomyces purpureus]
MPRRHIRVIGADDGPLQAALRALRTQLRIPAGFPPDVVAEAAASAKNPALPDHDATDIPFFTIDPPTSVDLDQAMHLARRDGGYRVHYAIADVAAFVTPGGAVDAEAHRRALTLYLPDGKVPLYPAVISEGAASLLPGNTAPALLWRIDLDAEGRNVGTDVRRALVRSRAKYDYAGVQAQIDAGTAEEPVALLKPVGLLRERLEIERGGVSLNVPEQEIIVGADGSFSLEYRAPRPVDGWNAQISLLTGMAAADLMTAAGTGILRTLPTAPSGEVARLRRTAKALGIDWPHHVSYAELIRSLDPHQSRHAAFLQEATSLLRGSDYTVFTGGQVPVPAVHAAVADEYTHVTAPLRRLIDRYAGELSLSAAAGTPPPDWVVGALEALRQAMKNGSRLANTAERRCVDIVEAALMSNRIGETFDSVVIDVQEQEPDLGTVHLKDPAVVGRVEADGAELPLGDRLRVRLTEASPGTANVLFVPA